MQPTPSPTPDARPPAAEPLVELIRTQRQNVGYALTAVAAVFLVASVMLAVKSNKLPPTTTDHRQGRRTRRTRTTRSRRRTGRVRRLRSRTGSTT